MNKSIFTIFDKTIAQQILERFNMTRIIPRNKFPEGVELEDENGNLAYFAVMASEEELEDIDPDFNTNHKGISLNFGEFGTKSDSCNGKI